MNKAFIDLQKKLASVGMDVGTIDGIPGPKSANALKTALTTGLVSFTDPILKAAKKAFCETPTRRTINDVYGTPKYKESTKNDGRITILNAAEWQKNFCTIEINIDGMEKPVNLMVNDGIACQVLGAFAEIESINKTLPENERWYPKVIQAYCPRHNRWDSRMPLSVHTWAAAIDIDPKQNGIGMKTNIPAWAIKVFESWGATWGGAWTNYPDPMHFQWMR